MADTLRSSTVTDHPFMTDGEWWDRCSECGLSSAAHVATTVDPTNHLAETYRCPDCVQKDELSCPHPHDLIGYWTCRFCGCKFDDEGRGHMPDCNRADLPTEPDDEW